MKASRDAKPPSTRPATGRAPPVRVRADGATAEAFTRFLQNLAKLEGGRSPMGKGGERSR